MEAEEYAKLRQQALSERAGSSLGPITSSDELVGVWEMRFDQIEQGPTEVQWRYEFLPDGTANVTDEQWQWELVEEGVLSLLIPVGPDSSLPTLEDGTVVQEMRLAFKTDDGRIVLSNDDTSIVELLTPVAEQSD